MGCLRTWRTQGAGNAATVCPVCRTAYADDLANRSLVARVLLTWPVASVMLAGGFLQRTLVPWLHHHAGGASSMLILSPLRQRFGFDLWRIQLRHRVSRWLCSGALSFALPAVIDTLISAIGGNRSIISRLRDAAVLIHLARTILWYVPLGCVASRELGKGAWPNKAARRPFARR